MQYGVVPAGLISTGRMKVMNPTAAKSPLGSRSSSGSMPVRQEWALQSMSVYATPSSNGILTTQTSGPVETKEAIEIMTIPVIGDNHENYSGEGKDHIEESYSLPKLSTSQISPQTGISEEENDTDVSGGNELFIISSPTKQGTPEASEVQNVLIQTTVQWELLPLPSRQPSHSPSVSKDIMGPEEARGEILYMHHTTEKSGSIPFKTMKVPLVKKKMNPNTPSASETLYTDVAITSELTTKASSTTDQMPGTSTMTTINSHIQNTDTSTSGNIVSTTDPTISVTWIPVVQEETQEPQTHVSAVTDVSLETASNTVILTTHAEETSQQAESKPAPTTGSTSGDNTSKTAVDYENNSAPSSGEFLLHCL